jgi:hypothetical protein
MNKTIRLSQFLDGSSNLITTMLVLIPTRIRRVVRKRSDSIRVDIFDGDNNTVSLIVDTTVGGGGFVPRTAVTFPSLHLSSKQLADFATTVQTLQKTCEIIDETFAETMVEV